MALLFAFYALVASGIEYLMLTFLTTLAFASPAAGHPRPDSAATTAWRVKGGLEVSFGLNPLLGNDFYWFVLAIVVGRRALLSWYRARLADRQGDAGDRPQPGRAPRRWATASAATAWR